jgi:glycosyltransferase involved in cell wall biosynthesis
MMPFAVPILTWDCAYNRATTAGSAPGFRDVGGLIALVSRLAQRPDTCATMGAALAAVAARRYRWDAIADAYFDLLDL